MSILAYCVSLSYDYLDAPTEGVGGAMIYELEDLGLRAWYSEVEEHTFAGADFEHEIIRTHIPCFEDCA